MLDKILIANRGEIACCIIQRAKSLGINTVAVYSEADANARHVVLADEAVLIGPATASASYLSVSAIIAAAKQTGAEAIHPGYGFLSENVALSQACYNNNIIFIGPPASAIEQMGSKAQAKALMAQAGVPLIPGYHGTDQQEARLREEAEGIGFPLLIKASAGGGGKGMRRVDQGSDFTEALAACRREAMAGFGDDQVLLEKYLSKARHVEIQVFGDTQGNYVYLFERDCSMQRRHQKVLEEAPAPGLTQTQREAMGAAAVAAARAVNYVGAGTVEFIRTSNGEFYFMEMNTRLQVEYPVTEMISGQDLIAWQLRVAAGEPLPLTQSELQITGHAIEARIYAEDPEQNFLPSAGELAIYQVPTARGVRVDSGVREGDSISSYYDPMIAKLIVHGANRAEALGKMRQALAQFYIAGVKTNIGFLSRLVNHQAYAAARLDTGLLERILPELKTPPLEHNEVLLRMVALLIHAVKEQPEADGFRLNLAAYYRFRLHSFGQARLCQVEFDGVIYRLYVDGLEVAAFALGGNAVAPLLLLDGQREQLTGRYDANANKPTLTLFYRNQVIAATVNEAIDAGVGQSDGNAALTAPMPGRVVKLMKRPGDTARAGEALLVMEAMKMEHVLKAPNDGKVKSYYCIVDEQVIEGALLIDWQVMAAQMEVEK